MMPKKCDKAHAGGSNPSMQFNLGVNAKVHTPAMIHHVIRIATDLTNNKWPLMFAHQTVRRASLSSRNLENWLRGLKQDFAKVPIRKGPQVQILYSPPFNTGTPALKANSLNVREKSSSLKVGLTSAYRS